MPESIANELLRGAAQIGAYVGLKPRRAFEGLQKGWLPGWREGNLWVSSRPLLNNHYIEANHTTEPKE
jgi:hypothetical protein